jgi:sterol 3beta-glucosyltransferase
MRISLVAIGSRGDVQPLVSLGVGLTSRGHEVELVAGDEFADLVEGNGVKFRPIGFCMQQAIEAHTNVFEFMRSMRDRIAECVEGDRHAVVSTFLGISTCAVARNRHIPFYYALPIPSIYTGEFANPLFPPLPLGRRYNAWTHRIAEKHISRAYEDAGSLFRDPRPTYMCCFSPEVVPRPSDWGQNVRITGYWFLDQAAGYMPPTELRDFLDGGEAPVAISLGSGKRNESQAAISAATKAVRAAGRRAIVVAGNQKLELRVPECLVVDSVPFDWLFPRVAVAVHHGGAGTTAEALRAGIPSIVLPFGIDQAFWGRRVKSLGVGLGPFDWRRVSERSLVEAVKQAIGESGIRNRVRELGVKIQGEDGVGSAISCIEGSSASW